MSKFVKLWTSAKVNGRLRHPPEGVLHLEDEEANRLISDGVGEDVTEDFSAEQRKTTPVERLVNEPVRPSAPEPFDPRLEEGKIIAERQQAAAPAPVDPLDHDADGKKGGSKPRAAKES